MTRVYLFCTAGMSTSMLAVKMQEVANKHNLPIEVKAFAVGKVDEIVEAYHPDCIMVGPQASFMFDEVKQKHGDNYPVELIGVMDYGMMDGEKVLKQAIKAIKEKRKKGEYDYESIDALDIATFTDNIQRLLKGEEVEIPKFSFETGQRYYDGEKLKIARNNVIIVEGIHGLNPQLTRLLPPETLFKIFVSALTSIAIDNHNLINPTDNRLIRRMVRDYKYRNYSALDTLKRWESVLLGEQKHIVPYQEEADAIFNSALIYELGALKTQAEPLLREVTQQHPEHSKALRLLKFFSYIRAVPTREIPPTSIIREFLGGSSFKY